MSGKIYLDLTTASSTILILKHVFIELRNGIFVGSRTNIKHERILGLQILTDSLEEPLVTINFTIIPLFDSKNKVDSPTFEGFIIETEVPGANLEKMEDVLWYVLDLLVHQLIHGLHLPFSFSVLLHETLLFKNLNIEKLVFGSVFFESFGDPLVAVTY